MDPADRPAKHPEPQTKRSKQTGTRILPSTELFADAQEVQILHAGETYRLRKTRSGKLILTK